ncbi:MAG TPA: YihY/virulence factor BrkB family protein [Flavobacteriaceae bacterium]|nr:YihY/virulence factor BrkB family protein [Flavobacteriaceae bacterium]
MMQKKLEKLPVVRYLVIWSKKAVIPWTSGLRLYDFLEIYIKGLSQGILSYRASSIAYSFFMAIFPFLLFVLNLIPYLPIEGFQSRFLGFMETLLPAQTSDFFYPIIEDIAMNPRKGLLSVSFVLSGILASNGVYTIFKAFSDSVYVLSNRTFIANYFMAVMVSLGMALFMIIAIGAIIFGEVVIANLQRESLIYYDFFWISLLQIVVFVLMIYAVIATLYYFGLKKIDRARFFSMGAIVTTLLFLTTTYLFSVYINSFSKYNELYGSIGALLIMMLYIWINANLLLIGFELNIALATLKKTKQVKITL